MRVLPAKAGEATVARTSPPPTVQSSTATLASGIAASMRCLISSEVGILSTTAYRSLHFVKHDHTDRNRRREGARVPRHPGTGHPDRRPPRRRARRGLLGLPVQPRLRPAARRRRGVRGPRSQAARRPHEPAVRLRLDHRLRRLAAGRGLPGQQPERGRRVRLRLLLPRRRRGRGLGALGAAALLAAAGCGGSGEPRPPPALRVTEGNPYLVAPGVVPAGFERWRDLLAGLRPRYLRVLVVWSRVPPRRGDPPDWSQPAHGCLR